MRREGAPIAGRGVRLANDEPLRGQIGLTRECENLMIGAREIRRAPHAGRDAFRRNHVRGGFQLARRAAQRELHRAARGDREVRLRRNVNRVRLAGENVRTPANVFEFLLADDERRFAAENDRANFAMAARAIVRFAIAQHEQIEIEQLARIRWHSVQTEIVWNCFQVRHA